MNKRKSVLHANTVPKNLLQAYSLMLELLLGELDFKDLLQSPTYSKV
jgi:hypothetical protein